MSRPRGAAPALAVAASLLFIDGCARTPQPGDPLEGLTREQLRQFKRGRDQFEQAFRPSTGLGPLFNADSCGECHESPVAGGAGDEVEIHVSAALPQADACDPLVHKGGPVIQQAATPALRAALGIEREPEPPEATGRARRTTPDVFGFGLLDAVPDATILALADPEDGDGDGISGRPNRFLDGRLGRFGRKAHTPTLSEFNAGAYAAEQGITSPAVPTEESVGGLPIPDGVDPVPEPEISQEALDLTDAFVRFLAPPAPAKLDKAGRRGRQIFLDVGCAACHVPALETGAHPIEALRGKVVTAYTDLLLHDMGPDLVDTCLGLASSAEFRTEPLMGLRLLEDPEEGEPQFLHDGRARSIEEAVRLHGGEASRSRDKFLELSGKERTALIVFLRAL